MLRGIIRDILSLYIGYTVIKLWWYGSSLDQGLGVAALLLFAIAIWFILERVGLLPKLE